MLTLSLHMDPNTLVELINSASIDLLAPTFAKGVVLMAIVGCVVFAMRNSAPSLRYRAWFTGIATLALLPIATLILPTWNVPILPSSQSDQPIVSQSQSAPQATSPSERLLVLDARSVSSGTVAILPEPARRAEAAVASDRAPEASTPAAAKGIVSNVFSTLTTAINSIEWQSLRLTAWLGVLWFIGVVVGLARLGLAHFSVARMINRSRRNDDDDWQLLLEEVSTHLGVTQRVRLRWSETSVVPLNAGLMQSVVLIPESGAEWSQERRRSVLLHELAHVKRNDCLTHFVTQIVRAIHWMNPFVWHAASEMISDREQAADDLVLAAGTKPSIYARVLLETAQAYNSANWSAPASLAMARKSQLENRMLAILDPAKRFDASSPANRILSSVVILLVAIPLAAFSPAAAQETTQSTKTAKRQSVEVGVAPRAVIAVPDMHVDVPPMAISVPGVKFDSAGEYIVAPFDFDMSDFDFDIPEFDIDIPEFDFEYADVDFAMPDIDFGSNGSFAVSVGRSSFEANGKPLVVGDSLTIDQIIRLRRYGVDGDFIREIKALGFDKPTYDDLVSAARHGAGPEYIRGMSAAGFAGLSLDEYAKAARYGMSPEYATQMRSAGIGSLTLDDLTTLSRYGADPAMVSGLRDAGLKDLTAKDVATLSRYGANTELIRSLKELGYSNLSVDDVVMISRYDVDADYIRAMRSAGYTNLSLSDVASLSRYDISADLVDALAKAGYKNLSVDELRSMGRRGVTPELIQSLGKAGYSSLSASEISSFARYGVDADYIASLKRVGLQKLSVDELAQMRRYDIDADFVESIKKAGVSDPSVEQLIKMRRNGVDADFIKSLRSN